MEFKWNKRQALKHLNAVADELIKAGYDVEQPKDTEYLDVWGFEGKRRKCFVEIYCTVHTFTDGTTHSYWTVDYDSDELIEVSTNADSRVWGIGSILGSMTIRPLRKAA